jgi:putative serine protease PepD
MNDTEHDHKPTDTGQWAVGPTSPLPGSHSPVGAPYGVGAGAQPSAPGDAAAVPPNSPAPPYGIGFPPAGPNYRAHEEPPTADPPSAASAATPARPNRPLGALLLVALLAAVVGGGVGAVTVALAGHGARTVSTDLKITNEIGAPAAKLDGTVAAAAARIRPSVVTINVTGTQASGTGSGVILRADGYILTNDHVVSVGANGGQIEVLLADGRAAAATIVGRDTPDDLAVIKIAGLSGLPAATFAKSVSLTVGQAVVAVGAPLGLSDTVTSGIVSNTARPVRSGDNDQAVFEAVQTDAAINPGNSGGPLVDLNGSVVGINAAIASDSSGGLQIPGQPAQQAGSIGIGFAIPSDEASRIASELIATGKASHSVIGVSVGGTNVAQPSTTGVLIRSVTPGGSAAAAGMQVGDRVTKIDDQRVSTADALIAAVRSHAPGDQVSLTYIRAGKQASTTVTLGSSGS